MFAAQVSIDGNVTLSSTTYNISSYSLGDVTVGNHSNRLLVVAFDEVGANSIQSITYGSESLSAAVFTSSFWGSRTSGIYYLVNPPVGTAGLTVNWGSNVSYGGMIASAVSLYNVDQSSPLVATAKNGSSPDVGGPTSVSLNLGTNSDVWLLDVVNLNSAATNLSAGTNQTPLANTYFNNYFNFGVSYEVVASGGSQTQNWNYSNTSQWSHLTAGFRAIPEPATASLLPLGTLLLLGLRRRTGLAGR